MRTFIALTMSLVLAAPVGAQGWIEPPPGHPGASGVVKVRTAVAVHVTGRVALVEVEEWFRNDGLGLGEGDYLYPLPGEAVFANYSLFQGDQELRGETMDATQARAIYEEIVRRKRDPALIELAGHGLIRARVFPINQGETRKITLRYTQVLSRAGDALQFRYAAGGRHGGPSIGREGPTPARPVTEPAPMTFTLTADSAHTYRDPFSPTHQMRVTREDGRLRVRPVSELTGDFTLFLPFARSLVGITLATHRPIGEDGYFMLTLSPGRPDGSTLPRDVTVVLDVSGSMSGSKLAQAKDAMRQLVSTLGPGDRFRLLAFSTGVRVQSSEWNRVTVESLRTARAWVDDLQADGGTDIAGALSEAFRLASPDERLPIVLFLTDGLPSVGEQNPERIARRAQEASGRSRVFAFGVGHDVNTYLLDRLSAAGRGATQYVEPGEDVEQALSTLAAKIQHPVLVELALGDAPAELTEIYPTTLPDLFAGEELVVFGRYRAPRTATGHVTIEGRRGGRVERFSATATFPDRREGNEYIPRLWASRKIGFLSQQLRLNGPNAELVEEIKKTALRYGLLSEYTSYLVQEPMDVAVGRGDAARSEALPVSTLAASPSAATGVGAVQQAKRDRARRQAVSSDELEAANEAVLTIGHMGQARHVAGRLFRAIDEVWTDLGHADSVRVVRVASFSEAYFAVLKALPELEPYVTQLGTVVVAGERLSIRIGDGGATTVSESGLRRLVHEFRGR
jgi:Ca-activated chloride channel family protein